MVSSRKARGRGKAQNSRCSAPGQARHGSFLVARDYPVFRPGRQQQAGTGCLKTGRETCATAFPFRVLYPKGFPLRRGTPGWQYAAGRRHDGGAMIHFGEREARQGRSPPIAIAALSPARDRSESFQAPRAKLNRFGEQGNNPSRGASVRTLRSRSLQTRAAAPRPRARCRQPMVSACLLYGDFPR